MTRTQVQQTVVVLSLVAFGGIWLMTRKETLLLRTATAPVVGVKATASTPAQGAESTPFSSEGIPGAVEVLRDPFEIPPDLSWRIRQKQALKEQERQKLLERPTPTVSAPLASAPPLELQGILFGVPQPQAIINRKVVSVGEVVEKAKVVSIRKEAVTVLWEDQEFELRLPQRHTLPTEEVEDE